MIFRDQSSMAADIHELVEKNRFNVDRVMDISEEDDRLANLVAEDLGVEGFRIATEHIKAPQDDSVSVAAVTEDGTLWVDDRLKMDFMISGAFLDRARLVKSRLLDMTRGGSPPETLSGDSVLIVKESIFEGYSAAAALGSARKKGASNVYIASPVVSDAAEELLKEISDGIISLERIKLGQKLVEEKK